ncbi:hypothetical protein ANTHELSMS3_02179 [Antarctobacter heliothermus]|uniref:Uncharacterized protein n=1 Tax=Antarctobacter heliothermus TaxID=74033 RepID=A0A222E3S9_9RHOB|nr:hypothetical protein [Antarctobacter heliothermus]ASP20857.1 hypothetical protein ANTHELSMS3_02179 [Antarctobacter heliothermus]
MFGILARSFLTATRNAPDSHPRLPEALPKLSWIDEDLPFRKHAGSRSGRDD